MSERVFKYDKRDLIRSRTKGYSLFVLTQKQNLNTLCFDDIPLPIYFIESKKTSIKKWFKEEINQLNTSVFGPKNLESKPWVDITFGGMAGVTCGLMDKKKKVISMARFCGHLQPDRVQLWTLMVNPKFLKQGLGTITLACVCALNKWRKSLSLITSIDNPALALYLKLGTDTPLFLIGAGFHHSNSPRAIAIEAKVPQNPFSLLQNKKQCVGLKSLKANAVHIDEIGDFGNDIDGKLLLVKANSKNISRLGEKISRGSPFLIVGWYDKEQSKRLFEQDGPVLVIEQDACKIQQDIVYHECYMIYEQQDHKSLKPIKEDFDDKPIDEVLVGQGLK